MNEHAVSGWRSSSFGSLCLRIVNGGTPETGNPAYWNGETPWITGADFIANGIGEFRRFVSDAGIRGSATSVVKQGNLLVVTRTGVGKLAIAPCDIAISQDISGVYINTDRAETSFVYYLLLRELDELKKLNQGTSINGIIRSDLEEHIVRFPVSKSTQRKIAEILCGIDKVIEKTEALITKYQQIKAGLMHDLFNRGVLPNGQLRPTREQAPELYQETAIGWVPRDWQYEFLDRLATRGSGHTPNKDHPEYWNGGVKWVSLADSYRLDQLYISDTDLKISYKGIQNSSAVLHSAGIVVLSRDAGVGKSAITTEPMAVSQHFMCWKCDKKMNNYFLYYWLQFHKRSFENIAMGSTILTIGLPYFKRLKIACPIDVSEQTAIAEKLKSIDSKLFSLRYELSKKKQQKIGLMQDLLTGKVPVKDNALEAVDA
ncbi:restriction endonuclease subunit S [Pseudomonas marginalis]|uniref:restriction endonuclease subunit S n=1 Tax=Pseudomonas marginalis TaxID=298 RepID=UPI0024800A04|nr:restriction endonuclease subunit S [Pseudomonas marginalis]WGT26609.1 restriction endonuclease subunit S [Pseudomonas marginalis]